MTKRNKNVPPDGGWGYVICASVVLVIICLFGHASSFGIIFNDFFIATNTKVGTITIVTAVTSTAISFTGILTNFAAKKYSLRRIAIAGGVIYTTGWALNIFIVSTYQMILSNGLLQGVGIGILTTTVFTSYNSYFDKRRVMLMSICQLIIGIGGMGYPLFLSWLLETYGFRGTVIIQTAIVANTIACAISLHPVKWHEKRIPIYTEVIQDETLQLNTIVESKSMSINDLRYECNRDKYNRKLSLQNFSYGEHSTFTRESFFKHYAKKIDAEATDIGPCEKIFKLLDLGLLRDAVLLNIMIGISFGMFTDYTFSLLLPLYLYSIGFQTPAVATCVSVIATADVVSRAVVAILSKFYKFKSRDMFFYPLMATCFARIVFIQCTRYWALLVMGSVIGFLRGILNIPINLIYAEYIPEKFTAAYGLSTFFAGTITTILSPFIGWIQEYTNSYTVALYTLSALPLFCLIPWSIEFWYFKRKRQNTINK